MGRPSAPRRDREQATADRPHDERDEDREADVDDRIEDPRAALDPLLTQESREEDRNERRRDAIVQPALDVQGSADADRDRPVGHDSHAQCGVGGSQHGSDECGPRPAELRGHDQPQDRTRDDREQESDTEEPAGNPGIAFDGAQGHRARIGEQQRSERDLGEGQDHFAVERELEQSGTVGAERHPGGHEVIGALISSPSSRRANKA
jgi:hypothetical protein